MQEVYIVYKTVNKVNNKFYIGVHKCANPQKFDGYYGSGSLLKRAIKKHGMENFVRETLFEFDSYEKAYQKEQEIVNSILIESNSCYNIKLGGNGGTTQNEEVREQFSLSRQGKFIKEQNHFYGRKHSNEARKKMSDAKKGKYLKDQNPNWKGGFRKKKFSSEKERQLAQSSFMKEHNPMNSFEVQKKHAESMKNKPRVLCPHCDKSMEMGGFTVHKIALMRKGIII